MRRVVRKATESKRKKYAARRQHIPRRYCTVTAIDLSLLLVTIVTTETVVDPVCKGVKLVATLSEPPGITTEEAMVPVVALVLIRFTVTDCPPATCWI